MKPIIVSGIQPSGRLHLGNYLGALKHFVELQESKKYDCYFFIADLHSLTENFEPKTKNQQILDLAASYLAAGLDPKKSKLFIQSHLSAHTELAWILNTLTPMGELERMTQFKDKSQSGQVNAGLFTYPALMAADILLYKAAVVPTGDDQDQHLELTRTLARKFNHKFGQTFPEPKNLHTQTPRIMALDDPLKKMSKSHPAGCLFIDDSAEAIHDKIMRAVTDSGREITYAIDTKPGIANLLLIASAVTGAGIMELEEKFKGASYAEFKKFVGENVANHFAAYRKKKQTLLKNPKKILTIFKTGAKTISRIASKTMTEVKKKVGLL